MASGECVDGQDANLKQHVDKLDEQPSVSSQTHQDTKSPVGFRMHFLNQMQAMKLRSKQTCLLLVISITVLAAIHNGILRTRKTLDPVKFFDQSSLVVDYEFGNLKELSTRASQNEVSFVMYYAPWDTECIRAKKEFETVAKHFSHQMLIAAINCWWPAGECRKYHNLKRFPVLVAHVRLAGDVEYKGPLVASYVISFLDNILDPVVPVRNEGDLLDLRSKHDAVLVGYFDFSESPQPPGYRQFFATSVKALMNDPWRSVAYSVVSNKRVALKLNIIASSTLTLYLLNSTEYYTSRSFKTAAILSWIYSRAKQNAPVRWITPSGIKSLALSNVLTNKPTFVLFTPRSFVLGISPYFDLLREVVMDYYNCDKSPIIRSIIHRSILRRHLIEEKLVELEEKCHEMQSKRVSVAAWNTAEIMEGDTCCHSDVVQWRPPGKSVDKKCFCTACVHVSLAKCPANCKRFNCLATASRFLSSFDPSTVNNTALFCNQIKNSYQPKFTPYYRVIVSCSGVHPSLAEFDDSHYSIEKSELQTHDEKVEKMLQEFEAQHCQRLNLGLKHSDLNFPESSEGQQHWRSNFTGLSCRANKTLNFVAIDSTLFPEFVENLGIDLLDMIHSTIGVIVDSLNENIFLLNHYSTTINKRSLVEFIKNYTSGSLQRFLRSETTSTGHCLNENNTEVICVPEITGETFSQMVLNNSKDVILMYYAPWCGFCSSVAHIYLSVAKFFADIKEISFARINGDSNDLPWEYTVDKYPSILFFPAKSKVESVVFPSSVPITTTSLIQFILANSQPIVRWQTSFQLCNRLCLAKNLLSYSSQTRSLLRKRRNYLKQLALVRLSLTKILIKKVGKNKKDSLRQLNIYKDHLIELIRLNRHKLKEMNSLQTLIKARIINYDDNRINRIDKELLKTFKNEDVELNRTKGSNEKKEKIKLSPTKHPKKNSSNINVKDEL